MGWVREYEQEHGLSLDKGYAGNQVFGHLLELRWPVVDYMGRHPVISRGHESGHENAADILFTYKAGDPKSRSRYSKEGDREWSYPSEHPFVSPVEGTVVRAEVMSTGCWTWIQDDTLGFWKLYHGAELLVVPGEWVSHGDPVMTPGWDTRYDENLIHMHLVRVDPQWGPVPPRGLLKYAAWSVP